MLSPRLRTRYALVLAWLRSRLPGGRARRLFVDCGSNLGQGFEFFRRFYPLSRYDFVLFEPNPDCARTLRERFGALPNVEIVEAAVWTRAGTAALFGRVEDDRGATSDGASILREHNTAMYDAEPARAVEVATVDFAEFLRAKASYDEIVVKMDIEASEYDVLERVIERGLVERVRWWFIEFHSRYMSGAARERFAEREARIAAVLDRAGTYCRWR